MIGVENNRIQNYMDLGISPTTLMPNSFANDQIHLQSVRFGSELDNYSALDLYLANDSEIAKEEIKILRDCGKTVNYNSPAQFQLPGMYDAGSKELTARQNAYDLVRKHLDYASEIGSSLFVITSCPDDPVRRNEINSYFSEFVYKSCEYAKERGINIVIEPIERHRFKKLYLGPTRDVVGFIHTLQMAGCDNLSIMIDFGHLPLMEETAKDAIDMSLHVGLNHVHFGDAILNPSNKLYGHMHPAMCEREGFYNIEDITNQFVELFRCGYLKKYAKQKPRVSLEVRPYDGVSAKTSAQIHYERMVYALSNALEMI